MFPKLEIGDISRRTEAAAWNNSFSNRGKPFELLRFMFLTMVPYQHSLRIRIADPVAFCSMTQYYSNWPHSGRTCILLIDDICHGGDPSMEDINRQSFHSYDAVNLLQLQRRQAL